MYKSKNIQNLTESNITKELESCIDFLSRNARPKTLLPPEYIHFQRQIDYLYLDAEPLVDCVYTTAQIEKLISDILLRMGKDAASIREEKTLNKNKSMVYKNDFYRFALTSLRPIKGVLTILLPKIIKSRIKDMMLVDRDMRLGHLFESKLVKSFIEDYYREDVALFNKVVGRR